MDTMRARFSRAGRLFATALFVVPILAALLAVAPAQLAAADPNGSGSGTATAGKTVTGTRTAKPPEPTAEQLRLMAEGVKNSNLPTAQEPEGANAKHLTSAPTIPQQPAPPKQLTANGTNGVGKQKADDFTVFQNTALPAGGSRSTVAEPSVASHLNVVFITANWYAAVSTDNGQTFTYINPNSFFPSASGGFCCDQEVIYDAGRDVWVWTLQYIKNTSGNTLRFATATTAGVIANTWVYYDFNAAQVAPSSGGVVNATDWFDYPNVSLSTNYFYYTSNVFANLGSFATTAIVFRIALSDLHAQVTAPIPFVYALGSPTLVPTQGATNTMYLVAHASTSSMSIRPWPEANPAPSAATIVAHTSYNAGAHSCVVTATGLDPCARDDTRVKTAWVSGGFIVVYWDVGPGAGGLGTFPYSYVQGARFNAGTLAYIDDLAIWDSGFAYAFPGAGVDGRGAIGTNIMFGGGAYNPGSAVLISDDFNGYALPGIITYTRFGTDSASALNRWGDYLVSRPAGGNSNVWVGVGFSLQGPCTGNGACANVETRFLRWGRERDNPFFGQQALPAIFRDTGGSGVFLERNSLSAGSPDFTGVFGAGTDQPLFCDWDGNGSKTPGVFRNGVFYTSNSYDGSVAGPAAVFGTAGDLAVCGDWTGTGHAGIGIFRNGVWYLRNTISTGAADITAVFGIAGDMPVVGDWDRNGTTTIGIFRNGVFVLSNSNTAPAQAYGFAFGQAGDIPLAGDWDRNGTTTVGVYRAGGFLLSNTMTGTLDLSFVYGGAPGDIGIIWG